MFLAVNQLAHARSFQPRYQEEAYRWTHLSQKLLFWRQFIFTHDSRDLLFYFQKNIFNNIEENELFLLDIFFLKRVLSWHVSWETIWQVLPLKIIWFFVCTWVIDAVVVNMNELCCFVEYFVKNCRVEEYSFTIQLFYHVSTLTCLASMSCGIDWINISDKFMRKNDLKIACMFTSTICCLCFDH